ncbi:hypothetical protein, partial [Romboutsia ilealis]|uniref:hypothetical protein n=1 Tax=Romboutsia ilealis TaxID=1115758 RepID=UPI0026F3E37F
MFNSLGNYINDFFTEFLLLSLSLIFISIFLWVKERFLLHYKSMVISDTIKNLNEQLNNEITLNKNIQEELKATNYINHKYSKRISALELYISKLIASLASNEEFSKELSIASELIGNLSNEFSSEMVKNISPINKTGISNIDVLLDYFKSECSSNNVDFNVIIKSNIKQ